MNSKEFGENNLQVIALFYLYDNQTALVCTRAVFMYWVQKNYEAFENSFIILTIFIT